jgi:hypothetical protein
MQLTRAKFPKQRDVMIINDVPVKKELDSGDKFSAISNLNMLTAFRRGCLDIHSKLRGEQLPGITYKDIYTTYLDYTYYGEPEVENNFDFNKEFRKRKELIDDEEGNLLDSENHNKLYHKLEHQKDVYISSRLLTELHYLLEEILQVRPKLIIVTGKWSLFFLTGCSTLTSNLGTYKDKKPFGALGKFRSSILQIHESWGIPHPCILVPMYHPVNAITMPDKSYIFDMDIQKLCFMFTKIKDLGIEYYIRPDKEYLIGDTFEKCTSYLKELLAVLDSKETLVSIDIETFFMSTIDCIGFAYEVNRGCCIPFASKDNPHLWSIEQEVELLLLVREVLSHRNCLHVGQNYQYDCQYYYKLWGIYVEPKHDTMVLHHILYNKLPKDLAFLASLYCEWYTYWKDEIDATKETPETRWIYNAKDCCYTLEILLVLLEILEASNDTSLQELYKFQMEELHPQLVQTMNRGVRVNIEMKNELYSFFKDLLYTVPDKINNLLDLEFNSNSTVQKKKLFKEYFGITLKTNKKKGIGAVETCDAKAMLAYIEEYPLLRPFLQVLLEYSALSKFTNTFLGMKLDADARARTQYRIAGTAFGRLASTKNVWGNGGNFQNLPEKGKVPIYYLLQLLELANYEDSDEAESLEFIEQVENTEYEN